MVEFKPLEGLEFDTAVAGDFGALISPPYDVVDAGLRRALGARSPYNIAHVTMPEPSGSLDKYAAAGELVKRWTAGGILKRGPLAFYVIEQRFTIRGREFVRAAVGGHARLAPWREAGIYPHEVTLPKPKADRLNLYRSTRMQHGPCFALFEDAGGAIASLVAKARVETPWREAEGPEGSHDRVWRVTGAAAIEEFTRLFAKEKFFIADGHHRYETALAYRDELAAGRPLPADHPANFVLMFAASFDDPGLVILPTHRLLCLAEPGALGRALESLRADYDLTDVALPSDENDLSKLAEDGLLLLAKGRVHRMRMKDASREALRRTAGALMADLNVFEVAEKVLPAFYGDVARATAEERIKYTHDFAEAVSRINAGECQAAVVLASVTVRRMAAVAAAGRTMPPKSTYFYPKLPTGVVLKPLE